MKNEYIITTNELSDMYGLNLENYLNDITLCTPIIRVALNKAITRVLYFNDKFNYESDIELALDNDTNLVGAFKKLQFQVLYNFLFLGDVDPISKDVDDIICFDLHWGKINEWQKSVFRR